MNDFPTEKGLNLEPWEEHGEVEVGADWKRPDGRSWQKAAHWSRELEVDEIPNGYAWPEDGTNPRLHALVAGQGTTGNPYGLQVSWDCAGFPPLGLMVEAADALLLKGALVSLAFAAGFPWPGTFVRLQQVGAVDSSPAGMRARLSAGDAGVPPGGLHRG